MAAVVMIGVVGVIPATCSSGRATGGLSPEAAIAIKTRLEQIIPAADELWPIVGLISDAYRAHLATPA